MPAPTLLPHDMKLFNRLKDGIDNANRGVESAHANLAKASIAVQAAGAAMNTFMEHCAEMYGLKPQDIVDAQGNIHLVDPGWAMEAAMRAQQEAAAQHAEQEDPTQQAGGEAPTETSAPVAEVEAPAEEVRVTRVEEEEPTILPLAVAAEPPAPVKRRTARAH